MTVCAVVVTYNRLNLLKECIDSLRAQTRKLDEILVINNSSTDGTLEWLNKQNDLTVITQPNSGGAGGFHTGIKTAYEKGHDWIWCMDDDCEINSIALYEIIINMLPSIRAYTTSAYRNNKSILYHHRGFIDFKNYSFREHLQIKMSQDPTNVKYIDLTFSSFLGLMINKELIKVIGLPEKKFFLYYDDLDYCLKMNKYTRIRMITTSVLIHKEISHISNKNNRKNETEKISNQLYYILRNTIFLIKKNKGNLIGIVLMILAVNIKRILKYLIQYRFKINIIRSIYRGIIDGLKLQ